MATITTKAQTSIQQPVIHRCTDKATHQVFYLVKSDSTPNTYYEVRWQFNEWRCNCPARTPCKHERAVSSNCAARRERQAEQAALHAQEETAEQTPATRTPVSCAICGAMTYSAIGVCGKHF